MATRRTAIDLSALSESDDNSHEEYYESGEEETSDEDGRDYCDGGRGGYHECDSGCEEDRYHRTRRCGRDSCDSSLSECSSYDSDGSKHECESACEEGRYHRSGKCGPDYCGGDRRQLAAALQQSAVLLQQASFAQNYATYVHAAQARTAQTSSGYHSSATIAPNALNASQHARVVYQQQAIEKARALQQILAPQQANTVRQANVTAQQSRATQQARPAQQTRPAQQVRPAQQARSTEQARATQQVHVRQARGARQVRTLQAQQIRLAQQASAYQAQQARLAQQARAQQTRIAQQQRAQQATAPQQARVAQQIRVVQQGAQSNQATTATELANGVASSGVTMTNTHVQQLVSAYRRYLAVYAQTSRVLELFPAPVWKQVLAYFQTTFPEVRLTSNALKAYIRRELQVDKQTPPMPRAAVAPLTTAAPSPASTGTVAPRSAASLPPGARPTPITTTTAIPGTSTVRIKPEIVRVAPVQSTTQTPVNGRTQSTPAPTHSRNFVNTASSIVKREHVNAVPATTTITTASPLSSTAILAQQVSTNARNTEQKTAAVSPVGITALRSDSVAGIVSISPVGPATKSSQSQSEHQRSLKRNHEMEELLELQELKRQKLVLENLKLARELGLITEAQSLEMGCREVETWECLILSESYHYSESENRDEDEGYGSDDGNARAEEEYQHSHRCGSLSICDSDRHADDGNHGCDNACDEERRHYSGECGSDHLVTQALDNKPKQMHLRTERQVHAQQARTAQEVRAAQQVRSLQGRLQASSIAMFTGLTGAATSVVSMQESMTGAHVKHLVVSYSHYLTEYERSNRVTELIPPSVWQRRLGAFCHARAGACRLPDNIPERAPSATYSEGVLATWSWGGSTDTTAPGGSSNSITNP